MIRNEIISYGQGTRTQNMEMDYMKARHYKYGIGRFQTPDRKNGTVEEILSWNLYGYVQGNPLKYTDPKGEMAVLFIIVTSQAVNAMISQIADQTKQMEIYLKLQLQMALNAGNMQDALGAATGLALLKIAPIPKDTKEFIEMGLPGISAMAFEKKGGEFIFKATQKALKNVKNPKLLNIIKELFRETDKIPGGTAGAIRYEIATGKLVGCKTHIIKGFERIKNLQNVLNKENLSQEERELAKMLLDDLVDALKGAKTK